MYRSLIYYYRAGLLSEDRVAVLCRAPYFGEYRYAVHFEPTITALWRFEDLRWLVQDTLRGYAFKLTFSPPVFQFNLHSNDPVAMRALLPLKAELNFNSVHIIDAACWHWRLPPPKPKGLYYGRFRYRIRFRDPIWATLPENIEAMRNIDGVSWMVGGAVTRSQFLYCETVRDVILAKLLFGDQIQEISDRSHLG